MYVYAGCVNGNPRVIRLSRKDALKDINDFKRNENIIGITHVVVCIMKISIIDIIKNLIRNLRR